MKRIIKKQFPSKLRASFIFFQFLSLFLFSFHPGSFAAEDQTKKTTTQQIGGLLFDVDEGVKVEQGPGGSVYVKSNREYMQEKFESIEKRLEDLEERIDKLEGKESPDFKKSADQTKTETEGRRVLVT